MPKITFRARSKTDFETQLKPVPAATLLPEWWRKQPPYNISPDNPDGKKFVLMNRASNASPKKCTPMLDAIVSGYIIQLWADVKIERSPSPQDIPPSMKWQTHADIFSMHGDAAHNLPHPPGYTKWVFKYSNCWIPETPKGYSILVTAPVGLRDAALLAIPAIVDSDRSTLELAFPMWVRDDFDGIVEKGTPLVQLTPFKRENWTSEFTYYENGYYYNVIEERNFSSTLLNHYVKNAWSKKTYK